MDLIEVTSAILFMATMSGTEAGRFRYNLDAWNEDVTEGDDLNGVKYNLRLIIPM